MFIKGILFLVFINSVFGCKIDVDGEVQFDLSSMKNDYLAHSFTDLLTGTVYLATACNSFPLLDPSCSINNAVASESNKCVAYGRYDALELSTYANANEPLKGVMVTYGDGVQCHSSTSGKGYAVFIIECDMSVTSFDSMLYNVDVSKDECDHIYYFKSPAGCGIDISSLNSKMQNTFPAVGIFFIVFTLSIALYCGIGIWYKKKTLGASGVEAIPNIDFIRTAYRGYAYWCVYVSNWARGESNHTNPFVQEYGTTSIAATTAVKDKKKTSYIPPVILPGQRAAKSKSANYMLLYNSNQTENKVQEQRLICKDSGESDDEDEEFTITFGVKT